MGRIYERSLKGKVQCEGNAIKIMAGGGEKNTVAFFVFNFCCSVNEGTLSQLYIRGNACLGNGAAVFIRWTAFHGKALRGLVGSSPNAISFFFRL